MIPSKNGYQAYQRNKYDTASPHRLILMLYEGAIRFSGHARKTLEAGDIVQANNYLKRSQDIVYELIACLNFDEGREVATNLNNLYLYVIDLLVSANTSKDVVKIDEAVGILNEIKSAWAQIGKEVTISHG